MKALRKGLKWLLIGVTSILLFSAIIVAVIWFYPETVFKDAWVRKILQKQSMVKFPGGLPEDFSLTVTNHHTWSQAFVLKSSPFCIEVEAVGLKGCLNRFLVEASLRVSRRGIGVEKIGPVHLHFDELYVAQTKPTQKVSEEAGEPSFFQPYLMEDLHLGEVSLKLYDSYYKTLDQKHFRLTGFLSFLATETPGKALDFKMDWDGKLPLDPAQVSLKGEGSVTDGKSVDARIRLEGRSPGKSPRANLEFQTTINLKNLTGELAGRGEVIALMPLLPKISIEDLKIRKDKKFKISAKLQSDLAIGKPVSPLKSALPAPEIRTRARAAVEGTETEEGNWKLGFILEPVLQHGVLLNARLKALLENDELKLEEAKLSAVIEDFQVTVSSLRRTQFPVIAPFNSLRGKVSLLVGDIDPTQAGLPITFETALSSNLQSFRTKAAGMILLTEKNVPKELKLKLSLDDIALQAPDFSPVQGMPAVSGDPRIVTPSLEAPPKTILGFKEGEKPEKPSVSDANEGGNSFPWRVDIETGAKPIRISHKILKPNAPFNLTGTIQSNEPASFDIQFLPMSVEFMARRADLERLKIQIRNQINMDGRFSIKRSGYTIYADLKKSGSQTEFRLQSEPVLSEDDMISLLLFNERGSELDDSRKKSVDDTEAALSKRAIGFFSFWLLASTPVEAVNYDPTSRVYSARVRLPGGISASVGSDWDSAQEVGLMKRIGGKWVISVKSTTDGDRPSSQESMLEWWNRY